MRTISGSSIPQPDCASRSLLIGGGDGAKARISKLKFGFVFVCFRGSKLHSIRATVVKIALRRVFNQFFFVLEAFQKILWWQMRYLGGLVEFITYFSVLSRLHR